MRVLFSLQIIIYVALVVFFPGGLGVRPRNIASVSRLNRSENGRFVCGAVYPRNACYPSDKAGGSLSSMQPACKQQCAFDGWGGCKCPTKDEHCQSYEDEDLTKHFPRMMLKGDSVHRHVWAVKVNLDDKTFSEFNPDRGQWEPTRLNSFLAVWDVSLVVPTPDFLHSSVFHEPANIDPPNICDPKNMKTLWDHLSTEETEKFNKHKFWWVTIQETTTTTETAIQLGVCKNMWVTFNGGTYWGNSKRDVRFDLTTRDGQFGALSVKQNGQTQEVTKLGKIVSRTGTYLKWATGNQWTEIYPDKKHLQAVDEFLETYVFCMCFAWNASNCPSPCQVLNSKCMQVHWAAISLEKGCEGEEGITNLGIDNVNTLRQCLETCKHPCMAIDYDGKSCSRFNQACDNPKTPGRSSYKKVASAHSTASQPTNAEVSPSSAASQSTAATALSDSYIKVGDGGCRDAQGRKPNAYGKDEMTEEDCRNQCTSDIDCVGFLIYYDGHFKRRCFIYNPKATQGPSRWHLFDYGHNPASEFTTVNQQNCGHSTCACFKKLPPPTSTPSASPTSTPPTHHPTAPNQAATHH